jgi:hypothetical protein
MSATATGPAEGDEGSVTPLLLAFAVCLMLMVSAIVDLSGTYLRRQSTASLADGAALSASDAAAAAAVYGDQSEQYVPIDEESARRAVAAYLSETGAFARYPALRASVEVVGGRTIVVELRVPYDLPISVPGVSDSVVIRVRSAAELPVY